MSLSEVVDMVNQPEIKKYLRSSKTSNGDPFIEITIRNFLKDVREIQKELIQKVDKILDENDIDEEDDDFHKWVYFALIEDESTNLHDVGSTS